MEQETDFEGLLTEAGVRITANRLLVLKAMHRKMHSAFTLKDIADVLPTMDNSSLFRTLSLFASVHLLHTIDDGTGMQKYCVCHCHDLHHHHGHIHLTCTVCHRTFCLHDIEIPSVKVPAGFLIEESEYIIKGVCSKCQGRGR